MLFAMIIRKQQFRIKNNPLEKFNSRGIFCFLHENEAYFIGLDQTPHLMRCSLNFQLLWPSA